MMRVFTSYEKGDRDNEEVLYFYCDNYVWYQYACLLYNFSTTKFV